jgi:RNA polymerase sigma-70 factor (ECF subfamily)
MKNDTEKVAELIEQALNNDEHACQKILNLYKGRIFSYVYRMVKNYHDAEDITFDTFIKCFKALGRFDTSKKFSTWLYTILFHREEHSYQEISEILKIPITTIKTRLHRARKKLRDIVSTN